MRKSNPNPSLENVFDFSKIHQWGEVQMASSRPALCGYLWLVAPVPSYAFKSLLVVFQVTV